MSATNQLREEHKIIEKVLKAMELLILMLKEGKDVPVEILNDTVDFITNFTDRCHHSKEEDALFPALEEKGMPREMGPIAVMLREHEQARDIARALGETVTKYGEGNKEAKQSIIQFAVLYVGHIKQHIFKENNILFNIADSILQVESSKVDEDLKKIQDTKIPKEVYDQYKKLADSLASAINGI